MKNSNTSPIIILLAVILLIAAMAAVYGLIQLSILILYFIFTAPFKSLIALVILSATAYFLNALSSRLPKK